MMADTGYAAYITANAGIVGLTRTLAREFGPDRIRVNAVAPGWVLTDRQKDLWVTPEGLARASGPAMPADPIEPEDMAGGGPVPGLGRVADDDLADPGPGRGVYLVMTCTDDPDWIAVDWGTSNLRAWAMGPDRRAGRGHVRRRHGQADARRV